MSSPVLPAGVRLFERGWLSSNNVLLQGDDPAEGAVLVDSGYVSHAAQTTALVGAALRPGERLAQVVNTHLHADHCGGNAALVRAFGCRITIPPGLWRAVMAWDEVALSYAPTGQRCERYTADGVLAPGDSFSVGGRRWTAHAAPGHDPHSIVLFAPQERLLISADALWRRGFGVVFPELDGERAFEDVGAVLDLVERLDPALVLPGHGEPFTDVAAALATARQRLAAFRADPVRHARHAMKVLLKFHLLEWQRRPLDALMAWFAANALYGAVWRRIGCPGGSLEAFGVALVKELDAAGVLLLRDGVVLNDATA
jgi:glyoxylase-like metal-dependent hydrolase (beta-lactamase superfamily II)